MTAMQPINSVVSLEEDVVSKTPQSTTALRNTYFASVPALLFILVLGYVSSYPAPATADMKKPGSRFRDITEDEITWIGSLPMISGIFGNVFSGYATQQFGRKAWLLYSALIYVIGWLSIAYAQSVALLYTGRILCGFCAASSMISVPTYLVEISPPEIRGRMSTFFHVAVSLGMLAAMSLGVAMRWSWLAVAGAAIVAISALLMLFVPESPPWLVRGSRIGEATRGLQFLRGRKVDVKMELQELVASQVSDDGKKIKDFQLKEVLDRAFYKPCLISVVLMFFHAFSGMSPILVYTVDIFQKTGSSIHPNVASIIIAIVQLLGTIVSSILMDRTGRRLLYLTSGFFVTLSLVSIGIYTYKNDSIDLHKYGWIPLMCLVACIFSFAIGLGPVPFVITPEISPLRSRSIILAVASFALSLFAFVVLKMYDAMQGVLRLYGLYWFYSLVSFCSIVFAYFVLPETKGMSLPDIETMLYAKKSTMI